MHRGTVLEVDNFFSTVVGGMVNAEKRKIVKESVKYNPTSEGLKFVE